MESTEKMTRHPNSRVAKWPLVAKQICPFRFYTNFSIQ